MKLRKLFAGVAAAATLFGGLAFGATTANAAEPNIKVNNSQAGHTYTAYKFADLKLVPGADGAADAVEVTTSTGWKDSLTIGGFDGLIAAAAKTATSNDVPALYAGNAAAYVTTFDQATLRKFADALTDTVKTQNAASAGSVAGADAGVADRTVTLTVSQGWYLVTDTTTDNDGNVVSGGASAIVATLGDGSAQTFPVKNDDVTQAGISVTGEFNAKHSDNNVPVKSSDKDEKGTVGYGESVTYTISEKIANTTNYDESHPLALYVKDVASKGLKVPTQVGGLTDFNAGYDENNNGKLDQDEKLPTTDFSIYSQTGDATKGTTTVIKINNVAGKDGKTLLVQYTAKVTPDAELNGVTNTPSVSNDNQNWVDGTPDKLKTTEIKFQKTGVDKDADGLNGAQFAIRVQDDNDCVTVNGTKQCYLEYSQTTQWDVPGWSYTTNPTDYTVTSATVDGVKGVVEFKGLAAGKYTVEEVVAPTGYSTQFKPKFNVEVKADGSVVFSKDAAGLVTPGTNTATVKNVKNITQLPLTGAAGTALFSVIGLLIAGAAVTVFAKSRSTKRALNA